MGYRKANLIASELKKQFQRELRLWVSLSGSPSLGGVRVPLRRVALLTLIPIGLTLGGVLLLADYLLLRFDRSTALIEKDRLSAERSNLIRESNSLRSEVDSLSELSTRAIEYEERLRRRVEEIEAIISSALSTSGVRKNISIQVPRKTDGVGGAEIDCSPTDECSTMLGIGGKRGRGPKGDLISYLDSTLRRLRALPVGAPGGGRISSRFGYRYSPFSRRVRQHQGIDLSLPYGSPVYSTASGSVRSIFRNGTYGLVVDIDHGSGIVSRYAHLSKALVVKGQSVSRNQRIALSGSSGRSTGPHVHYEVQVDGKPVDPEPLFQLPERLSELLNFS